MEGHGIGAGVHDGVGQENDLYLLLGEAAAVNLLKHRNQGVDEFRGVCDGPGDVRYDAERSVQLFESWLRVLGC